MAAINPVLGFPCLNKPMEIHDALPDPSLALPMQQHPNFARALRAAGRVVRQLTVSDAGSPVAHALVVQRRLPLAGRIGLSSQGPVWTGVPSPTAASRLRSIGLHIINAPDPDCACLRASGYRQIITAASCAELNLGPGLEDRQHGKWRNQSRKSAALGITSRISPYDGDPGHWLFKYEAQQRRERQYRALPLWFASAWAAANPGQAWVFEAYAKSEPIAAMLILTHAPVATYHIGWTSPKGRRCYAHNHLMTQAVHWLTERGYQRLDLGNLDTQAAPGLARFKLGTGAKAVELGGTWLALVRAKHV